MLLAYKAKGHRPTQSSLLFLPYITGKSTKAFASAGRVQGSFFRTIGATAKSKMRELTGIKYAEIMALTIVS
jgi:hypothetical protein